MRPPTACTACRSRRRKCKATEPGQSCTYCKERNVPCSFTAVNEDISNQNGWMKSSPVSTNIQSMSETGFSQWPNSQGTIMPSQALCEELVNLYFQYIHDTFHSLFHRPSLIEDVQQGTISPVMLLSIISLAARFSQDPFFADTDPRIRGRPYAREAERLLDLHDLSVHTIQTCVLLGAYVISEGEAMTESLYYSIACRLAMLIDLPNMVVTSRLEQEVNIRIWWTLNMIDVWSSNGVGLPRSIKPRDNIPYPMEEVIFLELRRETYDLPSPTMLQESAASLLTQMVKLNAILFEISELNRAAVDNISSPKFSAFEFDASVDALGRKLDTWYASIPQQLRDTPENLAHYASLGLGYFFVAVYLGYYHFGQLLYYQYLHEDSLSDEVSRNELLASHAAHYANKCKYHSTSLCDILYRAYDTPGCEVYYTMVGHVLVISSTVQLHTLLFSSSQSDIRAARGRLEKNFEILTRLQTFWPTLDVCFTRFREFHAACMDEKKKKNSFRLDKWMLQFLFEFGKPVQEKDDGELGELVPWKMTDLGFSPYGLSPYGM